MPVWGGVLMSTIPKSFWAWVKALPHSVYD